MKVSKRGEYAMRALCFLAGRHGDAWMHIGNEGGYALAKPPSEILLGEVIRLLDGPLAPMASALELCELMERNPRQVGFYAVLMDVRNAVSSIIDDTSLADVVRRTGAIRSAGDLDVTAP